MIMIVGTRGYSSNGNLVAAPVSTLIAPTHHLDPVIALKNLYPHTPASSANSPQPCRRHTSLTVTLSRSENQECTLTEGDSWSVPSAAKHFIQAVCPMEESPEMSLNLSAATAAKKLTDIEHFDNSRTTMPCRFNKKWFDNVDFAPWLEEDVDPSKAKCKFCRKSIDISTMGQSGLRSHMRGDKHKLAIEHSKQTLSVDGYLTSKKVKEGAAEAVTVMSLAQHVNLKDVLAAEILWVLKVVSSAYSFKSSEDIGLIWKRQFPDSEIAQRASCGETKCTYLCHFGVAPYFKSLLVKKLTQEPIVVLFDESLNEEQQLKQMDILVRFWNHDHVVSRYFTSMFLGHATAADMMKAIMKGLEGIHLKFIIGRAQC